MVSTEGIECRTFALDPFANQSSVFLHTKLSWTWSMVKLWTLKYLKIKNKKGWTKRSVETEACFHARRNDA